MTTDICLSPQYDWYIALSKISILGFQPLPIQKYSHESRSPEVTKGTNEVKDYDRFPIVVPKSDSGEPNVVSRQCLYQKLDEPRNHRAVK